MDGCARRPSSSHLISVHANQTADPMSQAKDWRAHSDVGAERWWAAGTEMTTKNQALSNVADTKRWVPNFRARPLSKVTPEAASTTHPHGPPPMANPSAVTPVPNTPTMAISRNRTPKGPPGSLRPTKRMPKVTLSRYMSFLSTPSTTNGLKRMTITSMPRSSLNSLRSIAMNLDMGVFNGTSRRYSGISGPLYCPSPLAAGDVGHDSPVWREALRRRGVDEPVTVSLVQLPLPGRLLSTASQR